MAEGRVLALRQSAQTVLRHLAIGSEYAVALGDEHGLIFAVPQTAQILRDTLRKIPKLPVRQSDTGIFLLKLTDVFTVLQMQESPRVLQNSLGECRQPLHKGGIGLGHILQHPSTGLAVGKGIGQQFLCHFSVAHARPLYLPAVIIHHLLGEHLCLFCMAEQIGIEFRLMFLHSMERFMPHDPIHGHLGLLIHIKPVAVPVITPMKLLRPLKKGQVDTENFPAEYLECLLFRGQFPLWDNSRSGNHIREISRRSGVQLKAPVMLPELDGGK